MKLLVDMNLSPDWVKVLNESHIEAVHWSSVGAVGASDAEIMAFARSHHYVVLTQDLDFSTILAVTQGEEPSVVQIRSGNLSPVQIGTQVIAAVQRLEAEIDRGALVTIDPNRTRVRLLPLAVEN